MGSRDRMAEMRSATRPTEGLRYPPAAVTSDDASPDGYSRGPDRYNSRSHNYNNGYDDDPPRRNDRGQSRDPGNDRYGSRSQSRDRRYDDNGGPQRGDDRYGDDRGRRDYSGGQGNYADRSRSVARNGGGGYDEDPRRGGPPPRSQSQNRRRDYGDGGDNAGNRGPNNVGDGGGYRPRGATARMDSDSDAGSFNMARDSPSEPLVDRKPVNRTGGRPNPRPTNAQPPANGGETTGEAGDTLSSFLAQVGEIQQDVSRLEQNMQQIRNIQSRILGSTMADEAANLNRQLDRLNDETSGLLQSCRKRLKQLSVATANMKPSNEKHTRKLQQSSVAKRLLEVADEFQKIQASFKQRYKQRMAREIKNARPDATPAEIERALDSNIGSAFSQQLLSSRNAQSRRVLQEVQTRQEALVKLEQSMTELVALFQEMQALLEVQQEVINEVEVHVETTVQHLEDGSKEMTRAVASAKSARKSKWYILVIVLVLLVIAAIVTYIYVIKPMLSK